MISYFFLRLFMVTDVSFAQFLSQTGYSPCNGISDICKAVHDFAMKIINAIKECFNATHNASTTGTPITTVTVISNPRNLIPFYYGIEGNDNHVTLQQILNWD